MSRTTHRICAVCHKKYDPDTDIGMWQCRQHPLDPINGYFACCGVFAGVGSSRTNFYSRYQRKDNLGCQKCDHNDTLVPYDSTKNSRVATVRVAVQRGITKEKCEAVSKDRVRVYMCDKKREEDVYINAVSTYGMV